MQNARVKDLFDEIKDRLTSLYDERESESIAKNYLLDRFQFDAIQLAMNKGIEYDQALFQNDLNRLEKGIPYQHVVGFTYFFGHKFLTTPDALIPRPETEELVEWIIKDNRDVSPNILDIGTGTGCIPISLKDALPKSTCSGIDISEEALILAKRNASVLKMDVELKKCDVLNEPLPANKYDVIVSNPPYIPISEKQLLHKNVIEHEPDLALFVVDNDPILFYRKIAEQALTSLRSGGTLYFEIHESFGNDVFEMLNSLGFLKVKLAQDLQGKDRMIRSHKPKNQS